MDMEERVAAGPRNSAPGRPDDETGAINGFPDGHTPEQARFRVDELADAIEAAGIDESLAGEDGVIGVNVSTIDEIVEVAYDPERVSPALLRQKIEATGHEATER